MAASRRTSPSSTTLSLPIRTGSQKPSALIDGRDFPHMGGVAHPDLARRRAKLVERHIGDLQRRQDVVAQRARRRAERREPRQVLAPAPALAFQLAFEIVLRLEFGVLVYCPSSFPPPTRRGAQIDHASHRCARSTSSVVVAEAVFALHVAAPPHGANID